METIAYEMICVARGGQPKNCTYNTMSTQFVRFSIFDTVENIGESDFE